LNRLEKIKKEESEHIIETKCIRKLRLTSFIEKFRTVFRQVSFHQQDCLEGLTFILDDFHNSLKIDDNENYNEIMDFVKYNDNIKENCIKQFKYDIENDHSVLFNIFYSYLSNQVKCSDCSHTITKIEKYKELSLDLDLDHQENNHLDKLISKYFSPDQLDGYKCDKCKKTNCFKKAKLLSTPKYLIVQLKRFFFNQETMNLSKISLPIEYPLYLDLENYYISENNNENYNGNSIYNLKTVINHLGKSFNGGHYTSFHKKEDVWYYADDENINIVDENILFKKKNKQDAYILFYEKNNLP
jgi:ubiquitin C-terminal hydrolase